MIAAHPPASSALGVVRDACRPVYRPRETRSVSQWADRYRVLPAGGSEPGRWDTDKTPYLREIMDSMADRTVRRVTFMKPSQVGGTEALYNGLLYKIATTPNNMLFAYPSDRMGRSSNVDRLHFAVHRCRPVAEKLRGSPRDTKTDELRFGRQVVTFVGAGTPANLKSRAVPVCLADELDEFKDADAAIDQLVSRTRTFPFGIVVDASTPTKFDTGVHRQYLRGDQRRYHVPCPHCGWYHALAFKQLRWEGGSEADPETAAATAHMVCPVCDGRIEHHKHKHAMNLAGVWVPEGQSVDPDSEPGRPVLVGEPVRPNSSHRSYSLNQLYSRWVPFGDIARQFVSSGRITSVFVNEVLGEPWQQAGDKIELHELDALRVPRASGGFKIGECPEQTKYLVRAIDVQGDSAWVLVLALGLDGRLEAVADALRVPAVEGAHLVELDPQFDRIYTTPTTGRRLRPVITVVDHGHRADEVESFCLRNTNRGQRVYAVKGTGNATAPSIAKSVLRLHRNKRVRENPFEIFHVRGDFWKDHLSGAVNFSRSVDKSKAAAQGGLFDERHLQQYGGAVLRLPEDAPRFLLDQLTAEHRVDRKDKMQTQTWVKRPGCEDNHLLDCYVYARAIANAFRLDRPAAAPAPKIKPGRMRF